MYRPEQNWQQTGSFAEPVTIPAADPADAPLVCVQVNASWLPYVLGALQQLCQPTTWAGTPAEVAAAITAATELIERVGTGAGCMDVRWNPGTCAIEQSVDGGATWTAITDWSLATVQACILAGISIRVDAGGNLQWSIDGGVHWTTVINWPPPPATVAGQTTADKACSIAAYLARDVIQTALAQSVSSYNAARSTLQNFANISDLLIFWEPALPLILNAVTGLYGLYTAGSIANLTAASTDSVLLHRVTCAIYLAILAAGQVTAGNFAAITAALAAVSYPSADASNAIQAFVAALGAAGLESLQIAAPWAVGDCSGCTAPGSFCSVAAQVKSGGQAGSSPLAFAYCDPLDTTGTIVYTATLTKGAAMGFALDGLGGGNPFYGTTFPHSFWWEYGCDGSIRFGHDDTYNTGIGPLSGPQTVRIRARPGTDIQFEYPVGTNVGTLGWLSSTHIYPAYLTSVCSGVRGVVSAITVTGP